MRSSFVAFACRIAVLGLLLATARVGAQQVVERDDDLADRPVSTIIVEGVEGEDVQFVLNNIRASAGDPYDAQTVRDDVTRIHALGRFRFVTAEAELVADGTVRLIFSMTIQPVIREIEFSGNKTVADEGLRDVIGIARGFARDDYLIQRARKRIEELYRERGFYLTEVTIDESELEERGVLIFRVIEGPRVRIKAIEFSGAKSFDPKQLRPEIRTREHLLLLRSGVVDQEVLAADVARLDRYYKDRGYLDVRVDREIQLSPDNREVKIIFYVAEGRQYTLGRVRSETPEGKPLTVYSDEQIAAMLDIKPGDVYSRDKLITSIDSVEAAYAALGRLDEENPTRWGGVRVEATELRSGPEAVVDLVLVVDEGERYKVGLIRVDGNFLTRDKVIRRLIRLEPGRPYDATELAESERRIRRTRLFNEARLTIQEPDPDDPIYRDLLVEVKERNTGSVNFGLAVGSDSGVFGEFSVNQTNFDIADLPGSLGELIAGRAFRGAGQRFNMTIRPGDEIFQYVVSLTEPHLFESDYALTVSGAFRSRVFTDYDEERLTGTLGIGRQLGDIWNVGVRSRFESVELTDIEPDAPTEIFADAGPDQLASVGLSLTRTTIGTIDRPGRGSRLELGIENVGLLGGDIEFWKSEIDYTVFLTLDEDFLGRKTTLRLNSRSSYIFGEDGRVPTYERFFLGGRSFRGFDFREVAPKGIRNDTGGPSDDAVGGTWLFFAGVQCEFPLLQETISGVLFVDSGTVTSDFGFDDYRVSIGAGVRLYIPQFGQVPIAFDFGFPVRSLDTDEEQVLSFSAELPF